MTAKDMTEYKREDKHHDLKQNPDSGGLLLLLLTLRVVNRRRNLQLRRHYASTDLKKKLGFLSVLLRLLRLCSHREREIHETGTREIDFFFFFLSEDAFCFL
uniref:Uncharacterized protein n=1 Tax=Arabidopsis thaliana TaxID=3702 RepID=Q8LF40_ARATH|nr:unknown [Arabidopsis thaliana]